MTYAIHGDSHRVGQRAFILPRANAEGAALAHDAPVCPANTLLQMFTQFAARDEEARLLRYQ